MLCTQRAAWECRQRRNSLFSSRLLPDKALLGFRCLLPAPAHLSAGLCHILLGELFCHQEWADESGHECGKVWQPPPQTGEKELDDLCAQEAGLLLWCFGVIHAASTTVKLANRAVSVPEAQGTWPGCSGMLRVISHHVEIPTQGTPSKKIWIY